VAVIFGDKGNLHLSHKSLASLIMYIFIDGGNIRHVSQVTDKLNQSS
jgi:hypothetical protein